MSVHLSIKSICTAPGTIILYAVISRRPSASQNHSFLTFATRRATAPPSTRDLIGVSKVSLRIYLPLIIRLMDAVEKANAERQKRWCVSPVKPDPKFLIKARKPKG